MNAALSLVKGQGTIIMASNASGTSRVLDINYLYSH